MFIIPRAWYEIKTLKSKGRGIFATHDIAPGVTIGDYIGTIIRPKDENEKRDGLYTMSGCERYDMLANPKKEGIHFINHSCAANCGIYPYRGHMLYVATRYIFKGEEITVNYMLGKADKSEKGITCELHACHCGSRICTGSMHEDETDYESWDALMKRESGSWQKRIPGKYGTQLSLLEKYPASIELDAIKEYQYNAFGSEKKSPIIYKSTALPSLAELRKQIRKTGRQAAFQKLHFTIYGIRNGFLLAETKNAAH